MEIFNTVTFSASYYSNDSLVCVHIARQVTLSKCVPLCQPLDKYFCREEEKSAIQAALTLLKTCRSCSINICKNGYKWVKICIGNTSNILYFQSTFSLQHWAQQCILNCWALKSLYFLPLHWVSFLSAACHQRDRRWPERRRWLRHCDKKWKSLLALVHCLCGAPTSCTARNEI